MERTHMWFVVVALGITCLAGATNAWATVGDAASGWFVEALASKAFRILTLVVVPLLLAAMLVFFAMNYNFGWVEIGPGISRLLISSAVLGFGVTGLLAMVGGQAAAAVLP